MRERESEAIKPETALPPYRAVRSLAWNRKMLPIIQARLERAESVIRAHLLLNGKGDLSIGPYHLSLDGDEEVVVTRLETSDWQQLALPEPNLSFVNSLDDVVETAYFDSNPVTDSEEGAKAR